MGKSVQVIYENVSLRVCLYTQYVCWSDVQPPQRGDRVSSFMSVKLLLFTVFSENLFTSLSLQTSVGWSLMWAVLMVEQ